MCIAKTMKNYCGEIKSAELLNIGLARLRDIEENLAPQLFADNPHQLMRSIEVLNILTNAEMIIHACLARKASAKYLHFTRSDFPQMDPPEWHKFITVRFKDNRVKIGELPIDYYGSLEDNYGVHNKEYREERLK